MKVLEHVEREFLVSRTDKVLRSYGIHMDKVFDKEQQGFLDKYHNSL